MHLGRFKVSGPNCLEAFSTFLADFYPEHKISNLGNILLCVSARNRWFIQSHIITVSARQDSAAPDEIVEVSVFGGDIYNLLPSDKKNEVSETYESMRLQASRFSITFSELTLSEYILNNADEKI